MQIKFTQMLSLARTGGRKMKVAATIASCGLTAVLLLAYSGGPGANGLELTGAPFNSGTCANCHSGGNFGASFTLQLLDGTTPVTQYDPGKAYTLRISMSHTQGTPQYGFQTTAATQNGDNNVNTWGLLPSGTQNVVSSGRNYVEQSQRLTTAVINLPWTGPAANTGAVVFYSAVNFVNRNFSFSGDQVVSRSLAVSENINLPVSLLYFKGAVKNGKAELTWAAATETNSSHYTIEKSGNGASFKAVAQVPSKNTNNAKYSFTDNSFSETAFYRLTQTDKDGTLSVFNIVRLKPAGNNNYTVTMATHAGYNRLIFSNDGAPQRVQLKVVSIGGKVIYAANNFANVGTNVFTLPTTLGTGLVVATVVTADGKAVSTKALLHP
ncbi:MAG: hypothetical protein EAY75_18140 [Bacteroidetes bacterium]|nr:MAG: hypothetical protein EAY75_18140 [Bacteroidota bacterium]